MMIELTDEQAHWVAVAIENSKASAERLAQSPDVDDQLDAGLLINRYTELEGIFPPPSIELTD